MSFEQSFSPTRIAAVLARETQWMIIGASLLLSLCASGAIAQSVNGSVAFAEGTTFGEIDDFRAIALFTTDRDWQAKWDTPPEMRPDFATTNHLARGESATLLVFFQNPATRLGAFDLICDLKIIRPNGKNDAHSDLPCGKGPLQGPPTNIRLTALTALMVIEPDDPTGTWVFEIGVTDAVRQVRVPLTLEMEVSE